MTRDGGLLHRWRLWREQLQPGAGAIPGAIGRAATFAATSGGLEALSEGGSAWREQLKKGASLDEARSAFSKTALLNLPIDIATNALPFKASGILGKALARGASEAIQETLQGSLSRITSERKQDHTPLTWGDILTSVPEMVKNAPKVAMEEGLPAFISSALIGAGEGAITKSVQGDDKARAELEGTLEEMDKKAILRWAHDELAKAKEAAAFNEGEETAENAITDEQLARYNAIYEARQNRDYKQLAAMMRESLIGQLPKNFFISANNKTYAVSANNKGRLYFTAEGEKYPDAYYDIAKDSFSPDRFIRNESEKKENAALEAAFRGKMSSFNDVNITDQLRAAGRDEKTAQAESEIFGAAFSRLAEREGVTPEELARMIKLEISKGEETDGGETRLDQRAYHGSPHRGIEKMSLQHIGTGEGNQAYGWGIYSAQDRELGEFYRDGLQQEAFFEGNRRLSGNEAWAVSFLFDENGNRRSIEEAKQEIRERIKPEAADMFIADLERLEPAARLEGSGQLYRLEVPENDVLLDWDKPLSEQPEKVKAAIHRIAKELSPETLAHFGGDTSLLTASENTGNQFYSTLGRLPGMGGEKGASELLLKHGIPGLRYLDGNSRNKGKGTHNFVVWDENAMSVEETYYQIGAKRKGEMDAALRKHRPDLNEKQRVESIAVIEKLGEEVKAGGSPKVEKAATHWLLKGHIVLPEDNYKVLDALKICEQQGLDPMRFDDPNAILAQYTIKETASERRVNPDTVPEFSEKRELPGGITVYTVQDDKAGQAAVRNIIDTHWGEDANPWCLAARNDGAWEMWEHYNGTKKRIAFKDGKLLAFSASDSDKTTWWDREDVPSQGIPVVEKKGGDEVHYAMDEDTGKKRKTSEKLKDGTERSWHENGQMEREVLPDGTERRWHENGQMAIENLPDGTRRGWYENGQIENEILPDGTRHSWYADGTTAYEYLPDGPERKWYQNGRMKSEILPDGTKREWYRNGQLESEVSPDGTIREWYENGQMESEVLTDGAERSWYENGQMKNESLPDGTKREWYIDGRLAKETLPDGTTRRWSRWDKAGNPASETYYQRGEQAEDPVSSKYVRTTERSFNIPVDRLHKTEPLDAEAAARARENMQQAERGEREKRAPLIVADRGDGTFSIIDGNNTFENLKALGAQSVPSVIVPAPYQKHVDSVESLYARNKEAQAEFSELLGAWQGEVGGELVLRPELKDETRVREKVERDYDGKHNRVLDVLAGSLVFDSAEQVEAAFELLKDKAEVVRIKDKWTKPDEAGYRDVNLNVRLSNGVIAELQIQHRGVLEAKNGLGHLLYEFIRANEKNTEMDVYVDQAKEISRAIYEAGFQGTLSQRLASSMAQSLEIARRLSSQTSTRGPETLLRELSALTLNTLAPSSSEQIVLGKSSKNSTANGTSSPFSKYRSMENTSTGEKRNDHYNKNVPQEGVKSNGEVLASITLPETMGGGEVKINLSQFAREDSFLHESGHLFLWAMERQAAKFKDDKQLQADLAAIKEFLGWKEGQKGFTREQHEKFAESFVAYVSEGKAPSPSLRSAFFRFKQWLAELYETLRNHPKIELTDEMRGVFDRMLAKDATFGADRIEIQQRQRDTSNDTKMIDLFSSPNVVARRHGKFALFFRMAKAAIQKQERMRANWNRAVDRVFKNLVSDREKFMGILLQGDALGRVFTDAELTEMGADKNMIKAYRTVRRLYDNARKLVNAQRARYGKPEIGYREGYVPHFFHTWRVIENGEILTSFRSLAEATKEAKRMLKDNPNRTLKVAPALDDFGGDAQVDAVTIGDMQYFNLVRNIQEVFALSPEEAEAFASAVARMRNRSRVFKNAFHRKGAKGFDTNMEFALRRYLNLSARFIAMDQLKHDGINLFERVFGRFGSEHKGLADYTKKYLQDCLGVPSSVEDTLNNWVRNSWIGKYIGDYLGDRPATVAANSIAKSVAILKLGFLNVSSAFMNATQLIGANAIIGEKYTALGLREYLRPTDATRALYRAAGVEPCPFVCEARCVVPCCSDILTKGVENGGKMNVEI